MAAETSFIIGAAGDKTALRLSAANSRTKAFRNSGQTAGTAVAQRALDLLVQNRASPDVIAAYISMRDEIDTQPLIASLNARGLQIALPVIKPGPSLIFRRWSPGDPLQPRKFGLQEPGDDCEEVRPSVVFVPLLAFDAAGNRLGYGAGYYDAGLASLRSTGQLLAVGVAFDEQEMQDIPHESHDQRLDAVITPSRTLFCGP